MNSNHTSGSANLSLPKGGGAIKGIGETFQPNLFTGTGNFSIPIATSRGRAGFGPQLTLQYSTGNGNGPFGLGWLLSIPRITRKTEKGLPKYTDEDVFVMSGAEDIVPKFNAGSAEVETFAKNGFTITRYRPRTEGLFARIEKWVKGKNTHWRAITKENITSVYGKSKEARIYDSKNENHVYEWLLQETYDAKGNHILYEYAREDPNLKINEIYEQNRDYNQLYLRRIYYGNSKEQIGPSRKGINHENHINEIERHYLLEVLFDYEDLKVIPEHPYFKPLDTQELTTNWSNESLRNDPFSSFRSGFEIRTLRRCKRVLMFHHFEELGRTTLVRSTDLNYEQNDETKVSFLKSAVVNGYEWIGNEYKVSAMPSVDFNYSDFKPHQQTYRSINAECDETPPRALNDPDYAVVDMFGDGLPDVVHSDSAGFRYWKNLGNGMLDVPQFMTEGPSGLTLSSPSVSFGDMGGDGRTDLLVFSNRLSGFFEMTPDGGWDNFKHLHDLPTFDLSDPNTRMVDLTGDGLTDVLMTTDHHFLWWESKGENGFSQHGSIERIHNLDKFPDVYFDDSSGRVRLADMSGDGLNDIVLIHNGRIDYWPNLGYGKFGPRITMKNSPRLEQNFDPKRLFLADLDGSGCADLVYVDFDKVYFWFNQSGNSWSELQIIYGTPVTTDDTAVQFTDFFGNGTPSLVWSYDFNRYPGENIKVLDFSGGVKPYVLSEMSNNMGATTKVRYAPSTRFYLESENKGEKWATKLPFPIQVVEKVESIDHISKTKLVTCYKYYHGYFDGREREFRGFGRVDQIDTEEFELFSESDLHNDGTDINNNNKGFHVPPVVTKNWFHTGVYYEKNGNREYFDEIDLLEKYKEQYYEKGANEFSVGFSEIDNNDALNEAYRSLRGSLLRTEVYALDNTERSEHPYLVTDNKYKVKQLQKKDGNNHAVFLNTLSESITYHYERNPDDPRVTHSLNLNLDDYGNITDSVSIAYPRKNPQFNEQGELKIVYANSEFINKDDNNHFYYAGIPFQNRIFEITGIDWSWANGNQLDGSFFQSVTQDVNSFKPYYWIRPSNYTKVEKRIFEWTRSYFKTDSEPGNFNISARLNLGEIESLGLPFESCQAIFTDQLVNSIYGTDANSNPLVNSSILTNECGYFNEDSYWWVPSGRQGFKKDSFFLPVKARDQFENQSSVSYDKYHFLAEKIQDPLNNEVNAENNYRVLQPRKMTDPNGNSSEVLFDRLGFVVATAVKGKNGEGDSLESVISDPLPAQINDSLNRSRTLLGKATTRIIYNLKNYKNSGNPNYVHTISREFHKDNNSLLQNTFLYSDGYEREIQTKIQAEPQIENGPPRWVGTGGKVYNNKGKPVKQFEPFFSSTHNNESDTNLVNNGVSPVIFYDPLERVVATIHPNNTYEKVVFDPWKQTTYDVNDTVQKNPRNDSDIKGYVEDYFVEYDNSPSADTKTWYEKRINGDLGDAEKQAAQKAEKHNNTPTTIYLDSLGRTFKTVQNNGNNELFEIKVKLDIEGNDLEITDPKAISAIKHKFDIAGRKILIESVDAGEKLILPDVNGNPIRFWDANKNFIETKYDELRRPTEVWVTPDNKRKYLAEKVIYGESISSSNSKNHKGQVYRVFDGAGLVENVKYDFKGNLIELNRTLLTSTTQQVKWNDTNNGFSELFAQNLLDFNEVYTVKTEYDALNRITKNISPDESEYIPKYNEANLLDSVKMHLKENDGSFSEKDFVTNIDYNEKGQRVKIEYGNQVTTEYTYEPETFRLKTLVSERKNGSKLQNLSYTYDPVGNITQIKDDAVKVIYHNQQVIKPESSYAYDPVYRLITATGREHRSMSPSNYRDSKSFKQSEYIPLEPLTSDTQALQMYTETYKYDKSGNIEEIKHRRGERENSPVLWTRTQGFNSNSNRILRTGADSNDPTKRDQVFNFTHDKNGNIENTPHLSGLTWDFRNQLVEVDLDQSSHKAYYFYDSNGQRIRKYIDKGNIKEERIYLGGFEIYRKHRNNTVVFGRETLHVMDDKSRIVIIETRKIDSDNEESGQPQRRFRYQLSNHLGSSILELDEALQANPISYEEYYPYGGTSFIGGKDQQLVKRKRYRYSGKERDDETGFYYYGARYYAPWMGRWLSCDPIGRKDGLNLFVFVKSNTINGIDGDGTITSGSGSSSSLPQFLQNIPETGLEVPNEATGLEYLEQLASHTSKEHVLIREAGKLKIYGGGSGSVAVGANQVPLAHTHPSDAPLLPDAADISRMMVQNQSRHLITKGTGEWSVVNIDPKTGQGAAMKLSKTGQIMEMIELLPESKWGPEGNWSNIGRRLPIPENNTMAGGSAAMANTLKGTTGRSGPIGTRAIPLTETLGGWLKGGSLTFLALLGALLEGLHIGTGLNESLVEGDSAGWNKVGFGTARLTLGIGGAWAVKAKLILAGGGTLSSLGAGVLAMSSLVWLESEVEAGIRNEKGPLQVADEYWIGEPVFSDLSKINTTDLVPNQGSGRSIYDVIYEWTN